MSTKDLAVPKDKDDIILLKKNPDRSDIVAALNQAGTKFGLGFFQYLAYEAFQDPKLAMKLLDKVLPSLASQTVQTDANLNLTVADIISNAKTDSLGDTEELEDKSDEAIEVEVEEFESEKV